jgi:hypothetical protein
MFKKGASMDDEFQVNFFFRREGHFATDGADPFFYRTLPKVENRYINTKTGKQEQPRSDVTQFLTVIGKALLSSKILATAIKTWLMPNRVKISISTDGKKEQLTFEGPNLEESAPQIERLIDAFRRNAGDKAIILNAQHIPEDKIALPKPDLDVPVLASNVKRVQKATKKKSKTPKSKPKQQARKKKK